MKKIITSALLIGALIFTGCQNSADDDPPPPAQTPAGPEYTVTFAGSTIPAQKVAAWGKAAKPGTNPAAPAGAAFKGWYKDGRTPWDFDKDAVTENTTLCPGWTVSSIEAVGTFLGSAGAAGVSNSTARHMSAGTDPNPDKFPIPVAIAIQLTTDNWKNLVKAIEGKGKKVSLDLSACTVGTQAGNAASTVAAEREVGGLWKDGKFQARDTGLTAAFTGSKNTLVTNTIAGIILPDAATELVEATTNINLIHAIRGNNITKISYAANASFHGGRLTEAYFPKITDIGTALEECQYLEAAYLPEITALESSALRYTYTPGARGLMNVYIPKVTSIGDYAFGSSGKADLTITLGATPPVLGVKLFDAVTESKKITVRVPAGSKAAYTDKWVEGLTGRGWSNGQTLNGPLTRNFTVTILEY
ncbi:MAG: hypothetical protein LBD37_04650 [Treponema sp.]|jgi:hypothetical protein|nr:hypothetical protein [Treponema sp.]